MALNALITEGNAVLLCLCTNKYSDQWAQAAAGYNDNWVIGCSADLTETLDLRAFPCCYVLDGQRMIVNKSLSVEGLMSAVNPNY